MSARDGAVSITNKFGYPIGPAKHTHLKGTKATPCCKRPCRCMAPKAFECQACTRDRHIAAQTERDRQQRQAGR